MFSEKALKEVPSENCHKVRDNYYVYNSTSSSAENVTWPISHMGHVRHVQCHELHS